MQLRRVAPAEDEGERVQADQVEDEDVPAPCGDHADVREAGEDAERPRRRRAQSTHPEEESGHDHTDREALVVVAACHRAHEVRGEDGHEEGRGNGRVRIARALPAEEPRERRRNRAEARRQQHAHVVHRQRRVDAPAHLVDGPRGELQAGVGGRADVPTERVPRLRVVPRLERVPAVLHHVLGRAVIEPRIELVDHAAVVDDGKEPDGHGEVEAVGNGRSAREVHERRERGHDGALLHDVYFTRKRRKITVKTRDWLKASRAEPLSQCRARCRPAPGAAAQRLMVLVNAMASHARLPLDSVEPRPLASPAATAEGADDDDAARPAVRARRPRGAPAAAAPRRGARRGGRRCTHGRCRPVHMWRQWTRW